jgi:hypothetical protein
VLALLPLFVPAAATPATAAATVATVPAVAPAAPLPDAPPAPEDAPPACAITLPETIAKKTTAINFFMKPPKRNHKGKFDGASTLAHPVKPLQH